MRPPKPAVQVESSRTDRAYRAVEIVGTVATTLIVIGIQLAILREVVPALLGFGITGLPILAVVFCAMLVASVLSITKANSIFRSWGATP